MMVIVGLVSLVVLLSVTIIWTVNDDQATVVEDDRVVQDGGLFSKADESVSIEEEFEKRSEHKDRLNIAVSGSSVAEGQGASSYEYTWPALLEEKLNDSSDWPNVTVDNYGVSGYKVSDLLEEGVV